MPCSNYNREIHVEMILNNGLPITNETATPIPFITEANAVARVLSSTGNQVAERSGAPPIATGPPVNIHFGDIMQPSLG